MKRRIILIVVIVLVLGVVGGGIFHYLRQNTGTRLRDRAALAIKAQKFEKAATLAADYIAQEPDDWQGHQILGQAHLRLGQYVAAREAFEAAIKLAPDDEASPLLALASAYSFPARRTLAREPKAELFDEALEQLVQANQRLTELKSTVPEAAVLDAREQTGLNFQAMSAGWSQRVRELQREEKAAEGTRDEAEVLKKRRAVKEATAKVKAFARESAVALLAVVQADGTRAVAARTLVPLCGQLNDKSMIEQVDAVMENKNNRSTLPLAAMRWERYRLESRLADEPSEQRRRQWQAFVVRLDALLVDSPGVIEIRLARADAAMVLGDIAMAKSICDDVLASKEKNGEARLLRARILVAQEKLKARAEDRDYRQAASILVELTSSNPTWDEAIYEYGLTAAAGAQADKEMLDALEMLDSRQQLKEEITTTIERIASLTERLKATGDALSEAERKALDGKLVSLRTEHKERTQQLAALKIRCAKEDLDDRSETLEPRRRRLKKDRKDGQDVARRAMQEVVRLNPGHYAAREFLVGLLAEEFGQLALDDASEYYNMNPASIQALKLYFNTAVKSDRRELARSILKNILVRLDEADDQIEAVTEAVLVTAKTDVEDAQAEFDKEGIAPQAKAEAKEALRVAQTKLSKIENSLAEAQEVLERFDDPRLLRVVSEGYMLLAQHHLDVAKALEPDVAKAQDEAKEEGKKLEKVSKEVEAERRAAEQAVPRRKPDATLLDRKKAIDARHKDRLARHKVLHDRQARNLKEAEGLQADARKPLKRAADGQATTAGGYLARARAMIQSGRGGEAEKVLKDGLAECGDQPELYFMLGQIDRLDGRILEAIEHYEAAVRLNGDESRYRLALARALSDTGDLPAAQSVLDSLAPSDVDGRLLRLQIALARGESVAAADVVKQFSDDEKTNRAKALMYYSNSELDKCIEQCTQELASKPGDHQLRMLLAQAYYQIGKKGDARGEFKRLLRDLPDQLPIYLRYAGVLAAEKMDLPAIEKTLNELPGKKAELIDMTMAWLAERTGDFKSAVTIYQRVIDRADATPYYKNRARLLRAQAMGRLGQVAEALGEFDALAGVERWDRFAIGAKVQLLARAGRTAEAKTAMGRLGEILVEARNAPALLRLVQMYGSLKASAEALAVCEQVKELRPKDTSPYMFQARILSVDGRHEQALAALTEASTLQPTDLTIQLAMAREQDALNRPRHALDILTRLGRRGPDGKVRALYERARLLTAWGLPAPAAEAFEGLAKLGHESSPDIQLALGRSLAQLGRVDDARKRLESVTIHAPQYVAARQVLASIASDPADKLTILAALDQAKPGRSDVLAQRMGILMGQKQPAKALEAYSAFASRKEFTEISQYERVSFFALTCMLEIGQAKEAWELARSNATNSRLPHWRRLAVLLGIDVNIDAAAQLLEGETRQGLNDQYLGLVVAMTRRDAAATRTWIDRADRLAGVMAATKPPQRVPPNYLLLSSLAAGHADNARKMLASFNAAAGIDRAAAEELVANAADDSDARMEAAMLLKATLAIDLGLRDLGRVWAVKALSNRPRCQWAAVLALMTDPDADACAKLLEMLHPKDCTAAMTMKAYLLDGEKKYAAAATIRRDLAAKHPDSIPMALAHAASVEKDGRLEEALALYQKMQATGSHPLAANNGAYLVTQVCPTDVTRVTEAYKWMDDTVKAYPQMAAFRETRGYLAFLLGKGDQARADIRQAIKGLTESPDAHYHLGLVEADIGDVEMARWHYEAAVGSCKGIVDRGAAPTVAERNAADLAAKALTALGDGKAASQTPTSGSTPR